MDLRIGVIVRKKLPMAQKRWNIFDIQQGIWHNVYILAKVSEGEINIWKDSTIYCHLENDGYGYTCQNWMAFIKVIQLNRAKKCNLIEALIYSLGFTDPLEIKPHSEDFVTKLKVI